MYLRKNREHPNKETEVIGFLIKAQTWEDRKQIMLDRNVRRQKARCEKNKQTQMPLHSFLRLIKVEHKIWFGIAVLQVGCHNTEHLIIGIFTIELHNSWSQIHRAGWYGKEKSYPDIGGYQFIIPI